MAGTSNDIVYKQLTCKEGVVGEGAKVNVSGNSYVCSTRDQLKAQLGAIVENNAYMSLSIRLPDPTVRAGKNFELFSQANALIRLALPGGKGLEGFSTITDPELLKLHAEAKHSQAVLYKDLQTAVTCTGESDGVPIFPLPAGLSVDASKKLQQKFHNPERKGCPTSELIELRNVAKKELQDMTGRQNHY